MEVKLLVLTLVAFMAAGSDAQIDVCGSAPLNPKIVGGDVAVPHSWPWMAALYRDGSFQCGGSLINNQFVLTAAQCVSGASPSSVVIHLAVHTLNMEQPQQSRHSVSRIIIHDGFNRIAFYNDIALLQLSSPVTFSQYINPVCLSAMGSEWEAGTSCWVTGWGNIQTNTSIPNPGMLREVNVPIMSNSDCKGPFNTAITHNQMCVGLDEGGKGACFGDTGGPMVKKIGSKWVQAGVVSFVSASGCALPNLPGVFTRMSPYQHWINQYMDGNQPGYVRGGTAPLVSLPVSLLMSILLVLFSAL